MPQALRRARHRSQTRRGLLSNGSREIAVRLKPHDPGRGCPADGGFKLMPRAEHDHVNTIVEHDHSESRFGRGQPQGLAPDPLAWIDQLNDLIGARDRLISGFTPGPAVVKRQPGVPTGQRAQERLPRWRRGWLQTGMPANAGGETAPAEVNRVMRATRAQAIPVIEPWRSRIQL